MFICKYTYYMGMYLYNRHTPTYNLTHLSGSSLLPQWSFLAIKQRSSGSLVTMNPAGAIRRVYLMGLLRDATGNSKDATLCWHVPWVIQKVWECDGKWAGWAWGRWLRSKRGWDGTLYSRLLVASIALWLPQPQTTFQESERLSPLAWGRHAISFQESPLGIESRGFQDTHTSPPPSQVLCLRVRAGFKGIQRSVTALGTTGSVRPWNWALPEVWCHRKGIP